VRRLTENDTCWHNRLRKKALGTKAESDPSSSLFRSHAWGGETMFPSSHNLSDDGRCLPEPSCPRASPTEKHDALDSAQSTRYRPSKAPFTWSEGHSRRQETCPPPSSGFRSQGCVVYANNGTHNRPALALLEMDVCVVGGFPFALVLLTMTWTLISIDQPPALAAMQAGFSSCIAAKVCFRTCLSSALSHGASIGTRNT
jgi:hypothetical protein